jgi:putative membrane protein
LARRNRWPRWVYGEGEEPDYRFSLANERTFLAWIRTALALLAGGVAVHTVRAAHPHVLTGWVGSLLVVLGLLCAVASWFRWASSERAMRRGDALPASPITAILTALVVVMAVVILVVML